METAAPIVIQTPKTMIISSKTVFVEESKFKKENEEYKVHFGIKINDLIIRVIPERSKNFFYYQKCLTLFELQTLSPVFVIYRNISDIISFLKKLKFDVEERNDELNIKFHIFSPDGQCQIIVLDLIKTLLSTDSLIKFLLEENKSIKDSIKNIESKHESEIRELKLNILNNQNEIENMKKIIENYKTEISNLKTENQGFLEENIKMKNILENLNLTEQANSKTSIVVDKFIFNSKILSINSMDFIFDYIREKDKSFKFNNIKLLYRSSIDGDSTKTCHELCDKKQNVLILILSDNDYIFGGYSKIGFETKTKSYKEYKLDNNCFLFSVNLRKIYPVIKDKKVICNIDDSNGLCFYSSLAFTDNFMNHANNKIISKIKQFFNEINSEYEMNGGNKRFKIKELEVFQLI